MNISLKTSTAVRYFGSKAKLARVLDITRQSLTKWEEYVPQTSALKIYIITDGKLGDKVLYEIPKRENSTL